ncbi:MULTISPECIES: DUF5331 domain-containing protein [unclassified Roseofilum]|uniref:DUF5331 domain-containing protein n=1 Tax=unclassified Roseofilum TaxID=2620099 RepID=UPI00298DFC29|nr:MULTISPECIES: DUF5331 domain-containing protein [unclassified Roseofilum]
MSMAFFDNFTASIRQKWLDYFQANKAWLLLQMEVKSNKTPDGGRRPASSLILGVVNALEPKLGNLMVPFFKLNADEDALVDVLGLNFDPERELNPNGESPAIASPAQPTGVSRLLPDGEDDL